MSTVLVTVGLVAIISSYTALGRGQRISIETELMQRLVTDKYDELEATEALQTQSLNGDFSDRGYDNYLWSANVAATGTENLSALTVTVTSRDTNGSSEGVVNGVVFIPPQTTTGSTTTPAPGGNTP